MIKIMLVDDEMLARMNIRSMLDWESLGFFISSELSDGRQAMEKIREVRPDIVITDIKMKYVNGDELVRFLYENFPEIKVIVLSSYDDYHYVRDTMKHQAVDYLIKNNLTPELLLEALNKALELGVKEKRVMPVNENNLQALRRQFVFDLICGMYHGKNKLIQQRIDELHLGLKNSTYIPVLLSLEDKEGYDSTRDRSIVEFSVCNMLEELILEQGQGMVAPVERDLLVLILETEKVSEAKQREQVNRLMRKGDFCLRKFLHRKAGFYAGEACRLEELDVIYQRLEQRRKFFFTENENGCCENRYNAGQGLRKESEERLYEAIRVRDRNAMDRVLDEIFGEIIEKNIPRAGCGPIFQGLILASQMLCKKYGIPYEFVYDGSRNVMEHVERLEKRSDCIRFFKEIYDRLFEIRCSQGSSESWSPVVQRMIVYIQENFREQVSLGEIAERLGRNRSYLSSVFKNEVGVGFTEYVNERRLEYARELMDEGNLKLKTIIERAGFLSYPYFFRLFKKKYGMTPNDYLRGKGGVSIPDRQE